MPRIRGDPERLRDAARQVAQASPRLNESRSHLSRGWGRLNASGWYGSHRARVEGHWGGCQSQIAAVAGQLSTLSQWLYESASVFEEADRAGVVDLGRVRLPSVGPGLLSLWGTLPPDVRRALERYLRLGLIPPGLVSILPALGGVGAIELLRWSGLLHGAERLPDWLSINAIPIQGASFLDFIKNLRDLLGCDRGP